jgi:hypothetical protein
MSEALQVHLTVNEPFSMGGIAYVRGDHIRDPGLIAEALRDYHHHVNQRIAHDVHMDGSFYGEEIAEE